MLAGSVLRYQNHALDAAAVVAELVALAKQLKHEHERGAELGLRDDELAFYNAICQNDSAVPELGDDVLKKIARELVDSVRSNATIDWSEKEQVRARMRATIRRLLTRYGYPPDKQPTAIELVCTRPSCSPALHSDVERSHGRRSLAVGSSHARSRTGGRPALFCGPNCRANFYNIRRQLESREGELVAMLHDAEHGDSAATDLNLVRWHLLRFQTRP